MRVLRSPTESSSCTQMPALSLKWMVGWVELKNLETGPQQKAQNTKRKKLREMFLPAPPLQLCRRAPFQLQSCLLSLVRDPREQLGHSHEPL